MVNVSGTNVEYDIVFNTNISLMFKVSFNYRYTRRLCNIGRVE